MKKQKKRHQEKPEKDRSLLWLGGIILATIIAYIPAFSADFTNWDDPAYVINNTLIHSFSIENIKLWFTACFKGMYIPLTLFSLAIDYSISGTDPWFYHFMNILLHVVNTSLLFVLARQMTNNIGITVITAALFGVHTLHVESVAWITERKDVLFSLFFLASLINYIKYIKISKSRYYVWSLIFFLLSLFTKVQAVPLAVTLFAADYLLGKDIMKKNMILNKIPYFILAIIFGIIAIINSEGQQTEFAFHERIAFAAYGFTHYILKLIFPVHLSAIYPYPQAGTGAVPALYWLYLIPVCIILYILYLSIKKSYRNIAFAIAFYIINIIIVLQLFSNTYSVMADRYSYIPSAGIFFLAGFAYSRILEKNYKLKNTLNIIIGAWLIILTFGTYSRAKIWQDSLTLWNDVLSKYPAASEAWNNRGNIYFERAEYQKALDDYNKAINLKPDLVNAYSNRGSARDKLGDNEGAIKDFTKAIDMRPDFVSAWSNRGTSKSKIGDLEGALKDLGKAIELNPLYPDAYLSRGAIRSFKGDHAGAIRDYNAVISIDPSDAVAYSNRGISKSKINDITGALADFDKAIELDPDFPDPYTNRGFLKSRSGDLQGAIRDYNSAIKINPEFAQAYRNRGIAYIMTGNKNQGCADLHTAYKLGMKAVAGEINKYCK